MAQPVEGRRSAKAALVDAVASLADELRELRAATAEENLELRSRIRRLEVALERRVDEADT